MTILSSISFNAMLKDYQSKVNQAIDFWLPSENQRSERLHKAMCYSMQAGGKRLRPILVIAGHQLFPSLLDPYSAAVAVEFFHTATLIHDDMPVMDDSDLRRGRLTCHRAFDEATALLAGDSLMVESFKILITAYRQHPSRVCSLMDELSMACGSTQLMSGQMEDLLAEQTKRPTPQQLEFIHKNKTAALIRASLVMGVLLTDMDPGFLDTIRRIGEKIGLAFQIIDDVLDVSASTQSLGKTAGADERNEKLTYPRFFGLENSKKQANELTGEAIALCKSLGANTMFLEDLCQYMLARQN